MFFCWLFFDVFFGFFVNFLNFVIFVWSWYWFEVMFGFLFCGDVGVRIGGWFIFVVGCLKVNLVLNNLLLVCIYFCVLLFSYWLMFGLLYLECVSKWCFSWLILCIKLLNFIWRVVCWVLSLILVFLSFEIKIFFFFWYLLVVMWFCLRNLFCLCLFCFILVFFLFFWVFCFLFGVWFWRVFFGRVMLVEVFFDLEVWFDCDLLDEFCWVDGWDIFMERICMLVLMFLLLGFGW